MQTDYRAPTIPPVPPSPDVKRDTRAAVVTGLIGLVVLGVVLTLLLSTKSTLSSTEADLAGTEKDLSVAQADLRGVREDMAGMESDLQSTETSLSDTKDELATVEERFDMTAECSFAAMAAWYETLDGSYDATGRALQRIVYSALCREVRRVYKTTGGQSGLGGFDPL